MSKTLRAFPGLIMFVFICASAADSETGLLPAQEQALRAIARGESFSWAPMNPAQAGALHAKAGDYLELYRTHHLPHGLNADVYWTDYERTGVLRLEGLGDSAAWTGHYLAAMAARYRVEPPQDLLAHIHAVLDKYELLSAISGREGYMARYAGPADDEGYRPYYEVYGRGEDPERPGLGKRAYRGVPPWEDLVWLGYSSRDAYDGINFGLATTIAYVDEPEVQRRARALAGTIVDRLLLDDWDIVDGKGHATRGTDWFKAAWMRTALTVNETKFGHLREPYERICRELAGRGELVPRMRTTGYFVYNLRFVRAFSMSVLEDDPETKAIVDGVLRRMHEAAVPHLNAHFAALYAAATGDSDNPAARAIVQGALLDFPPPPKFGHAVDHRDDPDVNIVDGEFTRYALLPRERVPVDFMWQQSPCLAHGSWDLPYELPGIDVFLPYWMGRAAGIIPAP